MPVPVEEFTALEVVEAGDVAISLLCFPLCGVASVIRPVFFEIVTGIARET
jgi:hypothetical protein